MEQNVERILDYRLFSDNAYFFAPHFTDNSYLKELIVKRYSDGIVNWKLLINSGRIDKS